jgi:hypothetical protein
MAKRRRRKTKVSLGSAPLAHAKQLRKDLIHFKQASELALDLATRGKCNRAQQAYENANYQEGRVNAHRESIRGGKQLRINITPHHRLMIAARKALESHCGRPLPHQGE